jgi:hypothetical protein
MVQSLPRRAVDGTRLYTVQRTYANSVISSIVLQD